MHSTRPHQSMVRPARRGGFTLVELLVVISIIALLIGILLPSLRRARAQANALKCGSNLHFIGIGLVAYNAQNDDYNVPSYNLPGLAGSSTNYTGGPEQPLDGWAPIFDRDKLVPVNEQDTNSIFFCPKTVDVEGMKDGQTGTDPRNPRGWTDWPLRFTTIGGDSAPKEAVKIPERGFNKIIRVSYWINAYNPIGNQPSDIPSDDLYYTASVGLGPDTSGNYIKLHKLRTRRASAFVVVADGVYMGRQSVTRLGDTNSRIGYRHPGAGHYEGLANAAFADGHVEPILGNRFPRALHRNDTPEIIEEKKLENVSGPTVYEYPEKVFP